jgi:hypothetical protein
MTSQLTASVSGLCSSPSSNLNTKPPSIKPILKSRFFPKRVAPTISTTSVKPSSPDTNGTTSTNLKKASTPGGKTATVVKAAFKREPVEYLSWKPEGTYLDENGFTWYLPNHIGYSDWVNREFIKIFDRKTYVEPDRPDRAPLFNYQYFIKTYFCPASPYRGILLNHHMGSGKSRTAIVTAEQFRKAGYKMIFMLPASLRDNAIGEIRLWGDSDLSYPPGFSDLSSMEQLRITNELNAKIRAAYQFVSYNSSRVLQDLSKIDLVNAVIIVDEVHDLVNTMANEAGKTGKMIYEAFMKARNCRFIMMSGTPPPINYPFELGLLFNILRGPMPRPNSLRPTVSASISSVSSLSSASTSFEVPSNSRIAGHPQTSSKEAKEQFDEAMYSPDTRLTAYPEDRAAFDDLYVDYKTKKLKNEELFRRRGIGLTSFFHGAERELYPDVIQLPVFKVGMHKVQFDGYLRARTDEIIRESKRSGKLLGPNTFRPNSRQFCNFGMPPEIDRPVSLSKFKKITFENPMLNSFESLWTPEQHNELADLFYCLYEVRTGNNQPTENLPGSRVSDSILEKEIQKAERESDMMFKKFRSRWATFKDTKARLSFLVNLIDEAGRVGCYEHIVNRNEEIAVLYPDQNINSVDAALSQLSGPYKNYLFEDLGKSSQKHLQMHQNIESGPGHEGPIFVYSSFRTMEGIEIFSRELDMRGYRKFDPAVDCIRNLDLDDDDTISDTDAAISVTSGTDAAISITSGTDATVDTNTKVSDVMTKGKRVYAILSGTESIELRTEILTYFNHPKNLRGKYLKILLGTSASAQGLSLKNCRQVHIMEPWWTLVLIQQVIGRVCRIKSHHGLPENERNVYVYEYLSTLTKEQSARLANEEYTTDEYLYHKAIEKDELNQQFYALLKEIAIDFVISAKENRPLENGLRNVSTAAVSALKSPYSVWHRSTTNAGTKPDYNFMPNMFDEFVELTDKTMTILSASSSAKSASASAASPIVQLPSSSPDTHIVQQGNVVRTVVERRSKPIRINGEEYVYFIDADSKPIIVQKLFKGETAAIRVMELYDYRAMKYSNTHVLRAFVDDNGIKRLPADLVNP